MLLLYFCSILLFVIKYILILLLAITVPGTALVNMREKSRDKKKKFLTRLIYNVQDTLNFPWIRSLASLVDEMVKD